MTNTDLRTVERHLDAWSRRLKIQTLIRWSGWGLLIGLAVGLIVALVGRATPLLPNANLTTLAVIAGVVGALVGLAAALLAPRSRLAAARKFDTDLGLAERMSTALELAVRPAGVPEFLIAHQWRDAAAAAGAAPAVQRIPLFRPDRRAIGAVAFVVAMLVVTALLPNAQDAVIARQQAVQQAIAEQQQALAEAIEAIENNQTLTEDQREALLEPLREAQQALQEPGLTEQEAQQALANAQQELRSLQNPNAQAQQQAQHQAGEALGQNEVTAGIGEALQEGDLQSAAEQLSALDPSQLSADEQQALAEQLAQAADALSSTDPTTAEALRDAAEALRNGNSQAASEALDRAAQGLSQSARANAQSQAAGQASDAVTRAQRAIAQAGQQGQGQQGQGQQGQGQGQQGQGQQGQGQGQGQQGQGQGQGQGQQAGGGSGTGTGNNGNSQGGPSGNNQGNRPGDGGESAYEPIYAPDRLGGDGGPEVQVPENGDGGDPNGDVVGQGPQSQQNPGDVTVPYNQVFPEYRDSAYSAVDEGNYPPELRDVVRDYFSSRRSGAP